MLVHEYILWDRLGQSIYMVGIHVQVDVKFLMLFKGSLLPPLTDLLSRIEGSVPQQYASF
jgi:hypothetical protein